MSAIKPISAGIIFFSTIAFLSVGYAAYSALSATKQPGDQISSSEWNTMATNLADHETRLANLQTSAVGKVLQVGYAAKGNSWSAATSGNSFYTVPDLSVTLTPKASTSKFLVTLSLYAGASNYQTKFRILRNGTPIALGAGEGGRPVTTGAIINYDDRATIQGYLLNFLGGTYMDAPNSTAPVTYQIQMASYDGHTVFLNRSPTWQNGPASGYDATPVSTINVMEIAP